MRHISVIDRPPVLTGKCSTPDGALTGNGDLAVILGSSGKGMRIFICKTDLWYIVESHDKGGLRPFGYIDIDIPEDACAKYHAEQDLDKAELRCAFGEARISIIVCKTENSVIIRSSNCSQPVLRCFSDGDRDGRTGEYEKDGNRFVYRIFDREECAAETIAYGGMTRVCDGCHYFAIATNHDTDLPEKNVADRISQITADDVADLLREHENAWSSFYSKSSFSFADKELETEWYASQYLLAICAGNKNFAPGLFGNFVTVEHPAWHSDYHLNYNYQAPFYAACSSNHPELTDCYMAPLEEFAARGKEFAARFGCRGILYPVGIGPKGICTEYDPNNRYSFLRLFLGQKSNAVHPADIPVFRWKATRDEDFAREHALPYVKEAIRFFEDYCVIENGRYCIPDDAAHEVPYYSSDFDEKDYPYVHDFNNVVTLGMLRLCLENAIDMASALGTEKDSIPIWKNMLANLAGYPVYTRFGKKVFRYTERGQRWNASNDVGLQHIFPAGTIGLSSDKELLETARNSFSQKKRRCYADGNAVSSFFPMAARLGENPRTILRKLREFNEKKQLPNMLHNDGAGCLEYCSINACTLNEMSLQSHQGVIRIFPCMDRSLDCSYENLRADGAFLVSAELKDKIITKVKIVSEKGTTAVIANPYSSASVSVKGKTFRTTERIIEIKTEPGDEIILHG